MVVIVICPTSVLRISLAEHYYPQEATPTPQEATICVKHAIPSDS